MTLAASQPPVQRLTPPRGWFKLDLRELWDYRELLYFFVWRDIKVRYKQTVVGAAWAVIQPFMTMVVFSLFFGKLARIPSEGLPYPIFYYSALLPWLYFAQAITASTNSMVDNGRLITKVYFPRVLLPLSAVFGGLVDFCIAFVVLLGMMAYYGMAPAVTVVMIPAFVLLALATALAAGVWLSGLNAMYRDVRFAVPFIVQFLMFASPVVYPSSLVPEGWRWLYSLNPMAEVIDGFRWSLTGRGQGPGPLLVASVVMVLVGLVAGLAYFRRIEDTMADVV